MTDDPDQPVQVELTDVLDLHLFAPRDIAALVDHYLDEACTRGWSSVRLIHGKGTGAQRRAVQRILDGDARVLSFETAGESAGGWGATIVHLRRA